MGRLKPQHNALSKPDDSSCETGPAPHNIELPGPRLDLLPFNARAVPAEPDPDLEFIFEVFLPDGMSWTELQRLTHQHVIGNDLTSKLARRLADQATERKASQRCPIQK